MKIAVLGSGFGLYGYLPAVAALGHQAILPNRYRHAFNFRTELQAVERHITWVDDDNAALDCAEALILARRPEDQTQMLSEILRRPHLKRVLLEKPIASTPKAAKSNLAQLVAENRIVRIGYTFRYLPWAAALFINNRDTGSVEINWSFMAHHYEADMKNWKRHVSSGGGIVRFFGIHLIAVLAELGYNDVRTSRVWSTVADEAECWRATFAATGLPEFRIFANSKSQTRLFQIRSDAFSADMEDPFANSPLQVGVDRRVSSLTKLCEEFLSSDVVSPDWYQDAIVLWEKIESVTQHILGDVNCSRN